MFVSVIFWLAAQATGTKAVEIPTHATQSVQSQVENSRRQEDLTAKGQAKPLIEEARAILEKLPKSDSTNNIWTELGFAQVDVGDLAGAQETARRSGSNLLVEHLLSAQIKAGQIPQALQKPDSYGRIDAYEKMSAVYVGLGKFDAAFATVERIPASSRYVAIEKLTRGMAKAKGLASTAAWARGISFPPDRTSALLSLASWVLHPSGTRLERQVSGEP